MTIANNKTLVKLAPINTDIKTSMEKYQGAFDVQDHGVLIAHEDANNDLLVATMPSPSTVRPEKNSMQYLMALWQTNKFAPAWHIYSANPEQALLQVSEFCAKIFAKDVQVPLDNNPDFMLIMAEIEQQEPSKSASKFITIEQLRLMKSFLSKSCSIAKQKMVIIFKAEMMNNNSLNSCLKILEEPPANCYIFLITHKFAELPATVVSRCSQLMIEATTQIQQPLLYQGLIDLLSIKASNGPLPIKIDEIITKLTKKNDHLLWQEFSMSCLKLINDVLRLQHTLPTDGKLQALNFSQNTSSFYLLASYDYINNILTRTYNQDLDKRQAAILVIDRLLSINH